MKKTLAVTWILFAFFLPEISFAIVDTKNANYSEGYLDISIPGAGYDLRIQRGYNSRTLYNGIYGFGWCSEFETSLEITPEGNLKLTECGAGQEVLYQAKSFSEKDIDKNVKTIIEKVKAENLSQPTSYFKTLEEKLKSDSSLRSEYATKYGIIRNIPDKTRYLANGKETDYIEKTGNNYSRTLPDGTSQKFKLNGKLEKIYDHNGNFITINYDEKHIHDIFDNNGRKLTFSFYENGKVKTIAGPNGIKAEYKFKNLNDLINVKISNGNSFTYEYDDLHNLTKVIFPDKKTREMTYDKNKDWILSYKDTDGCIENYDYQLSKDDPKNHYWATAIKKCQGRVVLKSRYEFWFAMKSDGTGKYLKKGRTEENDVVTEVAYNELGRPVGITKDKKTTKFEYYDNGLLKKKITPDGVALILRYDNPFKKVSKVERNNKSSEFTYDAKGNLVKAFNSDGQKISLAYDGTGRISTLEDQAKRKITIKYDSRLNKPSLIEREGVGAISVVYNDKGDITKVSSPSGSTVAVQVASAFNNLLDLIQPAGVNLNF